MRELVLEGDDWSWEGGSGRELVVVSGAVIAVGDTWTHTSGEYVGSDDTL